MKFSELKDGDIVFIDANIFIYHFAGVSEECRDFLKMCEMKEIAGVTGLTVLMEVCHKLMIQEAVKYKLISPNKPSIQLANKPDVVKRLSEYHSQILNIINGGIKIINTPENIFLKSQPIRSQFGLLTNDSLIPVYMNAANTNKLATNDKIFSNIPSIQVYSPFDI